MQIQALFFFALSATVISGSAVPQPALNTRAVGISSPSARSASALQRRYFTKRADLPTSPEVANTTETTKTKKNPKGKTNVEQGEEPTKENPKENELNGAGIQSTDQADVSKIPDTKEGIQSKIDAETKKLEALKLKLKKKEERISALEDRLKRVTGESSKNPPKKNPSKDVKSLSLPDSKATNPEVNDPKVTPAGSKAGSGAGGTGVKVLPTGSGEEIKPGEGSCLAEQEVSSTDNPVATNPAALSTGGK